MINLEERIIKSFREGKAKGFSLEYVRDVLIRKGYNPLQVNMIYNDLVLDHSSPETMRQPSNPYNQHVGRQFDINNSSKSRLRAEMSKGLMKPALMVFGLAIVIGIVFLSFKRSKFYKVKSLYKRMHSLMFKQDDILTKQLFVGSLTTAALFSVYYVMIKFAFESQPFISAYAWTRLGGFLAAAGLLLFPSNWKVIFKKPKINKC